MPSIKSLEPVQLARCCPADQFTFKTTAELTPLEGALGQERAVEAIEFGTSIERDGYNLYVMGPPGLGKHRLLQAQLEAQAEDGEAVSDWCYVANFKDPYKPQALRLSSGMGAGLRQDMEQLVEDLLNALPAAFQSEEYRRRAREIGDQFKAKQDAEAEAIEALANEHAIGLFDTPTGYNLVPMKNGKVISPKEFDALSEEEKKRYAEAMELVKEALRNAMAKVPLWQKEMRRDMQSLERDVTELTVGQLMRELIDKYSPHAAVVSYLEQVRADIVDNGAIFSQDGDGPGGRLSADSPQFNRYQINLLVGQEGKGLPVVYEDNPSYPNLIGRIEHISRMGTLVTDFTLIKPGALHRANGGYLVLDALKVLSVPFAWDALKRALSGGEIRIEPLERLWSLAGTVSLEPEPIPINMKVILVGERYLYYLLKAYDPEFTALFKVAADLADDMDRDEDKDQTYARLIATLQQQEKLRPLDRSGVARVIEWAARDSGDGEKLSLHMGHLADLLQEADHLAGKERKDIIDAELIRTTIEKQHRRVGQIQEHLAEAIQKNVIMIDTAGVQLAQVNGLSVLQVGDHTFGIPTRISATARIGSGEVVDIERETALGGPIHAKGVLILSSYLAHRYARYQPLSLQASLVFEQTYGMVEGDSASVAELCALLSAVGDIPIKQSLAVTGSINQHGQVQAIGGVNEKIEGFFDVCQQRGLSGKQGVVIPASNVKDLMLKDEVRQAVENEQFRIYAADHVDDVMTLLTGLEAGHPDAEGLYPEATVNGHVQTRLLEWTTLRQRYAAAGSHPDGA